MSASPKKLLVISAGAFGREIAHLAMGIARKTAGVPWELAGFLDDRPKILEGKATSSLPIFGSPDDYEPRESDVFFCGIGDPKERLRHAGKMRERGGVFVNLVSRRGAVTRGSRFGTGIMVGAFSLLSCDLSIGDDVCMVSGVNVGHDVRIGSGCQLSHGTFVGGGAVLGECVTVFPNATILPGVEIGDGATVGAGSVVLKNVPAGQTVFGVPAQSVNS